MESAAECAVCTESAVQLGLPTRVVMMNALTKRSARGFGKRGG
ncbi:hypothetical protein YW7DRAFT_00981 [Streptomyces sp. AmelKG-E11A]|nr:hypothetical protein YW7DRAFT_00981 [Streptomyces sp. AmelKG-E11A]